MTHDKFEKRIENTINKIFDKWDAEIKRQCDQINREIVEINRTIKENAERV